MLGLCFTAWLAWAITAYQLLKQQRMPADLTSPSMVCRHVGWVQHLPPFCVPQGACARAAVQAAAAAWLCGGARHTQAPGSAGAGPGSRTDAAGVQGGGCGVLCGWGGHQGDTMHTFVSCLAHACTATNTMSVGQRQQARLAYHCCWLKAALDKAAGDLMCTHQSVWWVGAATCTQQRRALWLLQACMQSPLLPGCRCR